MGSRPASAGVKGRCAAGGCRRLGGAGRKGGAVARRGGVAGRRCRRRGRALGKGCGRLGGRVLVRGSGRLGGKGMGSGRRDGRGMGSGRDGGRVVMMRVGVGNRGVCNRLRQGPGKRTVYKYTWSQEMASELAGGNMWWGCSFPRTSMRFGLSLWRRYVLLWCLWLRCRICKYDNCKRHSWSKSGTVLK